MQKNDDLERENQALRDRLSRLSEASRHINESLDLEAVLQGVLDSARSLTDASYALSTRQLLSALYDVALASRTHAQRLNDTLARGLNRSADAAARRTAAVDRHLPLRCHLTNLAGCAITYGANPACQLFS